MTARTILHADMDAFYAAIEQRDRPELRGRPVIVGGLGRRGVVATASYEARRFGVHSALPTAVARRRCPHGVFLPARMDAYAAAAAQVREVFAAVTPLVEPLSLDEAFLDVTGSRALLGDGARVAASIKRRVREATGLTVSVGVASCKYVAKVASDLRKPDGLVVVPAGGETVFLAPLPTARLWGAGKVTQERMARLGLRTIGDLQARSLAELQAGLGTAAGRHYHALCRGIDPRPVEPVRPAKSIGHETTFENDLTGAGACRRVLLQLAEAVGRRARQARVRGRLVRLKIRYPPFETCTRQRKLDRPTHDDLEIHRAAARLFEALPERPVRLLGVTLADLVPAGSPTQRELFTRSEVRDGRVQHAVDTIRARFGDDAIRRGG